MSLSLLSWRKVNSYNVSLTVNYFTLLQTRMFFSPPKTPQLTFPPFPTFLAPPQRLLSKGCRQWRHSMFVNAKPLLKDGTLSVDGKDALRNVPENVVLTPFTASSAFIGASSADASSRLVFKLGVIQYSFFSSVVSVKSIIFQMGC